MKISLESRGNWDVNEMELILSFVHDLLQLGDDKLNENVSLSIPYY